MKKHITITWGNIASEATENRKLRQMEKSVNWFESQFLEFKEIFKSTEIPENKNTITKFLEDQLKNSHM